MVLKKKQWEYLGRCWHLTPREMDVVKLVCGGLNNDQIGKKLGIKYNTVRAHLGNVFRKTVVDNKAGLILKFVTVLQKANI